MKTAILLVMTSQCFGSSWGTKSGNGLFSRMFAPRSYASAPVMMEAPVMMAGCQSQSYSQSAPTQSYSASCQSQSYSQSVPMTASCQSQNYSQSVPQEHHQATPAPPAPQTPKPQTYRVPQKPIVKFADIIKRNPGVTLTNHPSLPLEEESKVLEPIDEKIIQEYIEPKVHKMTAEDGSIWENIDKEKLEEKIKEINKLVREGNGGKLIKFK